VFFIYLKEKFFLFKSVFEFADSQDDLNKRFYFLDSAFVI
jgi:hypothetical protein